MNIDSSLIKQYNTLLIWYQMIWYDIKHLSHNLTFHWMLKKMLLEFSQSWNGFEWLGMSWWYDMDNNICWWCHLHSAISLGEDNHLKSTIHGLKAANTRQMATTTNDYDCICLQIELKLEVEIEIVVELL